MTERQLSAAVVRIEFWFVPVLNPQTLPKISDEERCQIYALKKA